MWVVLSVPLGMAFGTTGWAVLRGRGGVPGLLLFVLLSAVGASVGALAAEALGGSQADLVSGLGAALGALLASLGLALVHGRAAETNAGPPELLPGAIDTARIAGSSRIRSSTPGR